MWWRQVVLMEERLKVLKVMNGVASRLDLNEFARMVGLTSSQTIERMQELVKLGFVRKVGNGYGITEEGRAALKAFAQVPTEMEFQFYTGIGQPTGFAAKSLKDFYEIVKQVPVDVLEFHLYRGDFENWIRAVFKDLAFADDFKNMKKMQLKGENLRKEITKAAEARYAFQKLS
jgi:DNA-binding Lrp family transcriptional regulator